MATNTAASIIPITVNTITGSISVNPSVDDLAEFWAAVEPDVKLLLIKTFYTFAV